MDNYDALDKGIEPGGLRSRSEIKILICYLVNRLDGQITKSQLIEVCTAEGIVNYFELNQAVDEVINNGNITAEHKDENDILYITQRGKHNTLTLEEDIPYTIKEKAFNAAISLITKLKRERENNVEIIKLEKGYNIVISVADGSDKLISVTLFVADYDQAISVKEKFLEDPIKVYSSIVSLLMA